MKVLRICHTFPTDQIPSASIQQLYIDKYSKYKSIYFLREQNSKLKYNLGDCKYEFKNIFDSNNLILKTLNKLFLNFKMLFFFYMYINREDIIIHAHSINYFPFLIFVSIFSKKKTYLSLGGTDLYKIINFKFIVNLLSIFNKIFVISEEFKQILNDKNILNIVVQMNGVDHEIFYNKNLKKKNIILSVANIRKVKGIDTLIDAFYHFNKSNKNYKLVIIGKNYNDNYYRFIKKKIFDYKIINKVILTGSLNHNSVSDYMNESKLLVLSSTSEGFPKVIIESLSTETPVVSTNVGNVKSILKDCGLIVNTNNPKDIKDSIENLLFNKTMYLNCKNNCKKIFKKYTWKKVVKILDDEYIK
jgi:glycosyltransferase involved in cell wall biosynthesis